MVLFSCFIRPDHVFGAVVIPQSALLFHSCLCFWIILRCIFRSDSSFTFFFFRRLSVKRLMTPDTRRTDNNLASRIAVLLCMQTLLGIPWVSFASYCAV